MGLWPLMQLLLLGILLSAAQGQQGDELSSEEERKALMLKHLEEVLELSEMTDQEDAQEVLTEVKEPDGKEKLDKLTKKEELEEQVLQPTQPWLPSTAAPSEEEDSFTYVLSRLNSLEAAVHRLNVQFYHMDVRVSQFSQGLAELKGGLAEASESLASLNEVATRNQKELGRIDGCLRGRRTQTKCFLIFKHFEVYNAAQKLCEARGGHLAMPVDDTELAVLRRYLYDAFQPYNWPAWIGIHDRRSEGLWLFENGQRVSVFDWYRDHLVTQPNGGTRENCVSLSSDDGKWWDNDCERRMYYICEYRL
ncbi:C-type lectin domain family 11 member A [Protobothrops mucrosquamatus]|uniref:C-type lectin domain family 11 member A n=1 Tax=Protobothrops mucrosquamatus TaxID=103944 RepID=UPI000775804A|nr:C-type lectin domain family 11 member A [Protobothrops mucrosquamatus]